MPPANLAHTGLRLALLAGLGAGLLFGATPSHGDRPLEQSLAGWWHFRADPGDVGEREAWFSRSLPDRIRLPGSMAENGFGDQVTLETKWTGQIVDRSWFAEPRYAPYRQPGRIRLPFWLTPLRHYVGAAWYQREIVIPPSWQDHRVVLTLERCHWETAVWVDEQPVGDCNSLSTPHTYDLSAHLSPGRHRLTIRVDNRLKINVGENAHSVSDHTQGNWNGIVGELKLTAGPRLWIDDAQVYPDLKRQAVRVKIVLRNALGRRVDARLTMQPVPLGRQREPRASVTVVSCLVTSSNLTLETECPLGQAARGWDEFSPALYQLRLSLAGAGQPTVPLDQRQVTFGLRQLGQAGTQFTINDRPIFLRGTLECCIFPLTGYPPTDIESWKRVIRVCQAHGLNHIRFHSWCPPEAAFQAADELGFYYHVECAAWADVDDLKLRAFIQTESERILRAYGNHPSFCFLAYGNEPAGKTQAEFLGELVRTWQREDPRRKYTSAAGWPALAQSDYQVTPTPRIQAWGAGLKSRLNARPPETTTDYSEFIRGFPVPVISHEIGQWCVYPNLREASKYRGVVRAGNFEIFRDGLKEHQLLDQAHAFLIASGKLQALCYKEEIESALRTPGMAGFQLLDLHDFPGQGTALVGVLDPFWESKGYISSAEYRRFCGPTVPLALLPKRVFTSGEFFGASVKIAHFGPAPLEHARVLWRLRHTDGRTAAQGEFGPQRIPIGNQAALGEVRVPLGDIPRAEGLVFEVALHGTSIANDWQVWVYPAQVNTQAPDEVRVAHAMDGTTASALEQGARVLLLIPPDRVRGDHLGKIAFGFSPIFWNTAWTRRQAPHTLGILCQPQHPALAEFPTEDHTNWQWWYLIKSAQPMILDHLPPKLRPLVQVIDDWVTNRRLGLVFEARVGRGRLLACSLDLQTDPNPVTRQMLHSLLSYAAGKQFQPTVTISAAQVQELLTPELKDFIPRDAR